MQKKLIKTDLGIIQDAEKLTDKAVSLRQRADKKIQDAQSAIVAAAKAAVSASVKTDKAMRQAKDLGIDLKDLNAQYRYVNDLEKALKDASAKLKTINTRA